MDYYTDLLSQVRTRYTLPVDPTRLSLLEHMKEPLELKTHRSLIRDIFAHEKVETIPEDHPYSVYWKGVPSVLTWHQMLAFRAPSILDIREKGVLNPVDVFFDNKGVRYYHGYHRLACALELGHSEIPVTLHILDDALSQLAERLFNIYTGDFKYTLYQPVHHPMFQILPIQDANAQWKDKVATCVEATRGWTGTIYEVGAHFGMLTRELRRAGVPIVATDLIGDYLTLQPLFESVGHDHIPYERLGIQHLADRKGETRLVMMGLMHHLMGKADLWEMMQSKVLPWMQTNVPEMVVEMSLLQGYLSGPGAILVTSDAEVEAFWQQYGYTSQRLMEGSMQRVTYHVRRL